MKSNYAKFIHNWQDSLTPIIVISRANSQEGLKSSSINTMLWIECDDDVCFTIDWERSTFCWKKCIPNIITKLNTAKTMNTEVQLIKIVYIINNKLILHTVSLLTVSLIIPRIQDQASAQVLSFPIPNILPTESTIRLSAECGKYTQTQFPLPLLFGNFPTLQ